MPEGQYSGSRAAYIYESDTGARYILTLDTTLGDLPGTGLARAVSGNVAGATPKPTGFKPRVVYWQGFLGEAVKRKKLVCSRTGTLYASSTSTGLAIDGVTGSTTGRRGEQLSYANIPDGPALPG